MLISEIFFSMIRYIIVALSPAIVIAMIVGFIIHISDNKRSDEDKSASNNTAANVLLYIGSFFIILSFVFLLREEPSALPSVLMISSLFALIGGLTLYKTVKYLKPVALAFTYTAVALLPFWYYAFLEIGVKEDVSTFLTSIVSLMACIGTSIVTGSKVTGWLTYLWLIIFGWSCAGITEQPHLSAYVFFIWPLIVALFPAFCWAKKVKWMPVAFRSATKVLATGLVPTVAIMTLFTFGTPHIATDYPLLRTVVFGFSTLVFIIQWMLEHSHHRIIFARLCAQMCLIALVADIMDYSVASNNSHEASVAMAIIWLVSFLIQACITLIIPQKNDKPAVAKANNGLLIASIIGIFATPIFCLNFPQAEQAAINIAVLGVITVLSTVIAFRYRNIHWGTGTVIALALIPFEVIYNLITPRPEGYVAIFTYVALSALFLLGYFFIRNIQPKRSFFVICAALIACNLMTLSLCEYNIWSLCLFVAAVEFAALAGVSGKLKLLEPALYVAAAAGYFYTEQLADMAGWNGRDAYEGLQFIRYNIICLPLIGMGFYKYSYDKKDTGRLVIGYIILCLGTAFASSSIFRSSENILWPLLITLEHVILLTVGVILHFKWMTICSSIIAIITALSLTNGPNYLWLAIIGLALIVAVVVILTKNNQKQAESGEQKARVEAGEAKKIEEPKTEASEAKKTETK